MTSKMEDEISKKLSLSVIDTMEPKILLKHRNRYGITTFKDMTDLRQQLILHVMKENTTVTDFVFYSKEFKENKDLTFKEDELRRKHLEKYMDQISSIYEDILRLGKIKVTISGKIEVSEKDDPLITKINNEFENLQEGFREKKQLLTKTPSCALLICGDSGAGKSSFINLLIKQNLLPTSIRSNTACQVRLTYDTDERAEIVDLEGKDIKIDKEDFTKDLNSYLENVQNRNEVSCKLCTIFLNSPILEGGLDIYDTIGLGEKQQFNDELTKNLRDITGIIFLLKKNNPIGDNTVGGLSKTVSYMLKYGIPGAAMHFIINMCDLLEGTKEKDELRKNVLSQLKDKCIIYSPGISTFSTKRELFLQENNYISKDYEDILTHIRNLHLKSINTNTVSVFEFLFCFVVKTTEYIIESEEFAEDDKVKKTGYILNLRDLEKDRKVLNLSFKKLNEKFLKEKYEKCKREIERYFRSNETKLKVINEVLNSHSHLFGLTNNNQIDNEIRTLTINRILINFKEFIESKNILKQCCDEMLMKFLQQFAEHQKKKDEINQKMNKHIDSVLNYIKCDLTKVDFNELIGLPNYQRKFIQIFSPILVPGIEFTDIVKKEIESWFSWIISKLNVVNIRNFYENSEEYVQNKSDSYYSRFVRRNRNIRALMDCLFEAPIQVNKDFERYLEEDMGYLAKNIDLLDEDMRKKEDVIQIYKEIKIKLEELNNELCSVHLLYLQKDNNDIMREKVEIDMEKPIVFNRNRSVYHGKLKGKESMDSNILVFKNMDGKSWKDIYEEYIRHKDILKNTMEDNFETLKCFMKLNYHIIWSFRDSENVYPMFFVNGIDYSLRTYMEEYKNSEKNNENDQNKFMEIKRLVEQILMGLQYLHSHDLVHYDLTIDSIGYSSTYTNIKLCSISMETKVNVDYSMVSTSYVNDMAHFPSTILERDSKEIYTSKTDIYCLGTILYQLWCEIHPFFNVIQTRNIDTIDQFVTLLNSEKIPNIILNSSCNRGFGNTIFCLATMCWTKKATSSSLLEYISKTTFYGEI